MWAALDLVLRPCEPAGDGRSHSLMEETEVGGRSSGRRARPLLPVFEEEIGVLSPSELRGAGRGWLAPGLARRVAHPGRGPGLPCSPVPPHAHQ